MSNVIGDYIEFIYCACGCGKTTPKYRKDGNRYRKDRPKAVIYRHYSKETRDKLSEQKKGEKNPMFSIVADKHPRWKGDNIGYMKMHDWIRKYLPKPDLCQICGLVPPKDCANISGKYFRDFDDWLCLCKKCHANYDKNKRKRSSSG